MKLGSVIQINKHTYNDNEGWKLINYLDTGNITENCIDSLQQLVVGQDKIPSRAKRKVLLDSILYSTVRPNQRHYGIIKAVPDNFLVSTGFAVIDVRPDLADADFIYYFLTQSEVEKRLQAIAEQSVSAYPSIKPSDIENLDIELPDLNTQKRIASVLKALTAKIESNSAINDNLAS